jgi:hypothetical protein
MCIHEKALFDRLVAAQERMSAAILDLLDDKEKKVLKSEENRSRFIDTDEDVEGYYTILHPEKPEKGK